MYRIDSDLVLLSMMTFYFSIKLYFLFTWVHKLQPSKFVVENKLLYPEGCVIKYILRHQDKGGKQDLEKAKHFIDMIIERDYK